MTNDRQKAKAVPTAEQGRTVTMGRTVAQQVQGHIVQWTPHRDGGTGDGTDIWEAVISTHAAFDADASAWMDPRLEHSRAFFADGSALLFSQDPDRAEWEIGTDREYTNGRRMVRYTGAAWERLLLGEEAAAS